MGDPGQFEQESEMMSHQEDRLLLVENDTMHDTMIRDLLNSKPTVKGKQMKQSSNFSASAELAKALSLAQNGTGNEQQHRRSLRDSLQQVRD